MKHLANISHWKVNNYYNQSMFTISNLIPQSFSATHLHHILNKFVKPGNSILEIGVAPGLHLIDIAKKFSLEPYGLDYSAEGVRATKKNFEAAGYNPSQVFKSDFFDDKIQKNNFGKFDIVYSAGFIEHFDDVKAVLEQHRKFVKPGGIAIVTIPNLKLLARWVPADVLAVHNRSIMSPAALRAALPTSLVEIETDYYGGLFNIGLIYFKKEPQEFLRKIAYSIQRVTIDQFQKLLLLLTEYTFRNSQTTPDIYLVARNKPQFAKNELDHKNTRNKK